MSVVSDSATYIFSLNEELKRHLKEEIRHCTVPSLVYIFTHASINSSSTTKFPKMQNNDNILTTRITL